MIPNDIIPSDPMRGAVNKTSELLPCPFCGGEASAHPKPMMGYPRVMCETGCLGRQSASTIEEAVANWNRRAPEPQPEVAATKAETMGYSHSLAQPEVAAEPVGYRWRFEDQETWTVQKNKPHWYTPDQSDIIMEPLYATPPVVEEAVKAEPRVRELEWQKHNVDGTFWTSQVTICGEYKVKFTGKEWDAWVGVLSIASTETCAEAKAAAFDYHRSRILSALSSGDAS